MKKKKCTRIRRFEKLSCTECEATFGIKRHLEQHIKKIHLRKFILMSGKERSRVKREIQAHSQLLALPSFIVSRLGES